MSEFTGRYGPWALIAGGAQGIGAAFAHTVASRGLNVVVLDVCARALAGVTAELEERHGVECLGIEVDLARPDLLEFVTRAVADREVGLLIYNAAIADVGPFYKQDTDIAFEQQKLAVNVSGPLVLSYHFARPMLARRAGGIILMSSGAGLQGSPYYAHYSATKAYNITLAEALWGEFKPYKVDVLACVAGMTLSTAAEAYRHLDTSSFQTPVEVVDEALAALGQQCTVITGEQNRSNREAIKDLSREQLVELISQQAIKDFLGGEVPEQNI